MAKVLIRIAVEVPVTDEELYDLCVKSNGEGELDQTGRGYFDVDLTLDQVKGYLKNGYEIVDDGYLFISEEDLEKYDKWFIEEKKKRFGRYDRDPLFNEEGE